TRRSLITAGRGGRRLWRLPSLFLIKGSEARPHVSFKGSEADPSPQEVNSWGPPPRLRFSSSLLSSLSNLAPVHSNGARFGQRGQRALQSGPQVQVQKSTHHEIMTILT